MLSRELSQMFLPVEEEAGYRFACWILLLWRVHSEGGIGLLEADAFALHKMEPLQ